MTTTALPLKPPLAALHNDFDPEYRHLQAFARRYRLKIRHDECHDAILPGKRGHLYFAGGELCLMACDGSVAKPTRWKALNAGRLWLGDISPNAKGRRVQDVKVEGIPESSYKLAIRLAGCKARKKFSPETLEKYRANAQKARAALGRQPRHAPESTNRPADELGILPAGRTPVSAGKDRPPVPL
jgi:hypothetical protein